MVGVVASQIPSAGATPTATASRIAGADRYATAAEVARATFPDDPASSSPRAPWVVIARGDLFPDALVGSYVAGQQAAPILLTRRDDLPDATRAAVGELGTRNAAILGDSSAVGDVVEQQLKDMGLNTVRYSGTDRYATAAAVAATYSGYNGGFGVPGKPAALLVSGESYPDALAAGAVSAGEDWPLLLTQRDVLPQVTLDALRTSNIGIVFIVGGSAVIGDSVAAALRKEGFEVRRLAGATRQATAVAVAEFERTELEWPVTRVLLAAGDRFPDGVSAGARGGRLTAPILLTQSPTSLSATTAEYLRARTLTIGSVDVIGGSSAISDEAEAEAVAAARGESG